MKQNPTKSKKVVYKRMIYCAFLVLCNFFLLLSSLSIFLYVCTGHIPYSSLDNSVTMWTGTQMSQKIINTPYIHTCIHTCVHEKVQKQQRNTSLSTNFRWHKKTFIADTESMLYLLFLDMLRSLCGMQWYCVANKLTLATITSAWATVTSSCISSKWHIQANPAGSLYDLWG